jgi:hypothetical protein
MKSSSFEYEQSYGGYPQPFEISGGSSDFGITCEGDRNARFDP